jgi:hypothetical protein
MFISMSQDLGRGHENISDMEIKTGYSKIWMSEWDIVI